MDHRIKIYPFSPSDMIEICSWIKGSTIRGLYINNDFIIADGYGYTHHGITQILGNKRDYIHGDCIIYIEFNNLIVSAIPNDKPPKPFIDSLRRSLNCERVILRAFY